MIKKILAGVCLIFSTVAFSQQNNASPYSYYGIGDTQFKGTVENRSMGGLGILSDSVHINLQNPASYAFLKFTTYSVGVSNKNTKFTSDSGNDSANRTTFDYLAVALPFNKLGFSFGLMPYTSVGYKIENQVTTDNIVYNRNFEGSGGLNRAYIGAAYRITPKFSLGINAQYNFGNIQTKSIVGASGDIIQYPTRELNESHYGGLSFNLGGTYHTKLNKLDWVTSATFTPKSTLNSTTGRKFATILLSSNNSETVVDEIDAGTFDDDVKLPSVFTFGTGFGEARKWFAGVEYSTKSSNSLGGRFNSVTRAAFERAQRVSLGGYFIPSYYAFNSYLSKVTYRGGFKYEKMGLIVNNQSIDDVSFSLGMGLPLGGGNGGSNLNVGLELGKRGPTRTNLVRENYVNIMVSLSLNDRWFIKRKYD